MTGSANTPRNVGFCSAPTCCQMKPITMTPVTSNSVSARLRHRPLGAVRDSRIVNVMRIPPNASRPQLTVPRSTSKPLAYQGMPVAANIATMVSSQLSLSSRTRGLSQPGRGINCVRSMLAFKEPPLAWIGLRGDGRTACGDRTVAEVVVVQKRLRTRFMSIGRLEILDVKRVCMRAQHLVVPQDRRVADHIDSIELRLYDRIADRRADLTSIPEHEGKTVAAVVQPIAPHQRVGRPAYHHAIRSDPIQLVVIDVRAAGVLGDDAHRCAAVDAVLTDHRARAHYVNIGVTGSDEFIVLHQDPDIAGDDPDAVRDELIVMDGDDIIVRSGGGAYGPEAGVLVFFKLIVGDCRIVPRRAEAHTQAVFEEVVALQQGIAGIVGHFHADVARGNGRCGKMKAHATHQYRGIVTIADGDPLDRSIRARDVEHRSGTERLRIDLHPRGLAQQSYAMPIDECRQGRFQGDLGNLDRDAALAGGGRHDEQGFAQRAGPSIACIGDMYQHGFFGGAQRRRRLRYAPMTQCRDNSKQDENTKGGRQAKADFHVHSPCLLISNTNTACQERVTARRPKSASMGNESAVASASRPSANVPGNLRTYGSSRVLKGAGSTPVSARRSRSHSRNNSR